jgi:predicted tellurium resistance membrane protein TerC
VPEYFDISIFATAEAWIALATLTAMEIVLGIDNIVFLSIVSEKLPPEQRAKARSVGLALALVMRLGLLFAISWVMGLTDPILPGPGDGFSGRDLILGLGGLFLVGKATHEIFEKLEVEPEHHGPNAKSRSSFTAAIVQILLLDLVFSLDSVITAVGMAQHILIMIIAMVVAVVVMLIFAGGISAFVNRHPSMQILALSFLLLIGVMLVAESFGQHVNKGYIYFAMAFSLAVELVNMRFRKKQRPVHLHPGPRAP